MIKRLGKVLRSDVRLFGKSISHKSFHITWIIAHQLHHKGGWGQGVAIQSLNDSVDGTCTNHTSFTPRATVDLRVFHSFHPASALVSTISDIIRVVILGCFIRKARSSFQRRPKIPVHYTRLKSLALSMEDQTNDVTRSHHEKRNLTNSRTAEETDRCMEKREKKKASRRRIHLKREVQVG